MEYEIRHITPDELEPFSRAMAQGFGNTFNPEHLEFRKEIFEFDRNLGVLDGNQFVGTSGIFTYTMTVPGGAQLGCGGVTMVTVRSTHRRQGILTGMMRRMFEDIHERNEPLAALWASEASIYGRFGYGQAIQSMELNLPHEWSALKFGAASSGRCRMVEAEEAAKTWPAFWAGVGAVTPGWVSRSQPWWDIRIFRDHPDFRDGQTTNYYVNYEESGRLAGIVRYRMKMDWDIAGPKGKLIIAELVAPTPEAYAGLWRYLIGVDLVSNVNYENASMDEPIYWMLADPRHMTRAAVDAIWVRLIDVEAALSGRKYGSEGRVVVQVDDPFLTWCDGRYEIEGGPDGGVARRTTATADITLGAADLATVYYGGARLESLRRAGRVEGDARAIAVADSMFGWHQVAHCPEHF